jgi:hypothetical protein
MYNWGATAPANCITCSSAMPSSKEGIQRSAGISVVIFEHELSQRWPLAHLCSFAPNAHQCRPSKPVWTIRASEATADKVSPHAPRRAGWSSPNTQVDVPQLKLAITRISFEFNFRDATVRQCSEEASRGFQNFPRHPRFNESAGAPKSIGICRDRLAMSHEIGRPRWRLRTIASSG